MLETVLPLIHFMKQGKSSGSGYMLGGIHSDFCFHCFVKYDTVTERNGFTSSLTTLNYGHAHIKNVSTILPELDCIVCYKKTVTLANLCEYFLGPTILAKTVGH